MTAPDPQLQHKVADDELAALLADVREQIVAAGFLHYMDGDPVVPELLPALNLPSTVLIVKTVLADEDERDVAARKQEASRYASQRTLAHALPRAAAAHAERERVQPAPPTPAAAGDVRVQSSVEQSSVLPPLFLGRGIR